MDFQKSMLNWGGQIWAQCAFCYIGNLFGVMVFQKSMIDWGVHLPNMSTMCILLYRKLIWCHGFPEIYDRLGCPSAKYEHNVHSAIYETYLVSWISRNLCSIGGPNMSTMCILLYRKLIWCNGFPEIYAQLGGQIWAQCAFCYIGNLFGVMVFQKSMLNWGAQIWAQCAFCYTWNLFGVMVFQRSMLDWRGSIGQIWAQCAFCHNVKLIWCHGFPEIYAQLGGQIWANVHSAI